MLGDDDTSRPGRTHRPGEAAHVPESSASGAAADPASHSTRHGRSRSDWPTILRNIALALALLAGVWAVFNVRLPSVDVLQADIAAAGFWGFAVFVLIYMGVAATPLPVTIMATAGGLIYGMPFGTILSMV